MSVGKGLNARKASNMGIPRLPRRDRLKTIAKQLFSGSLPAGRQGVVALAKLR